MTYLLIKTSLAGRVNQKREMSSKEWEATDYLRNHITPDMLREVANHVEGHPGGVSDFVLEAPHNDQPGRLFFTHRGTEYQFEQDFYQGWKKKSSVPNLQSSGYNYGKQDLLDAADVLERYHKAGRRVASVYGDSSTGDIGFDFFTPLRRNRSEGIKVRRNPQGELEVFDRRFSKPFKPAYYTPDEIREFGKHISRYPGTYAFSALKSSSGETQIIRVVGDIKDPYKQNY